ncbi:class I SAM-dependent methyltransferase [uncultured Paludibaculum sp.]|uniref:class I SAM-dependent methyltransferase n=1 Tax=uncultured Paludibaculum sp. TaxID=1765020 RepID=UPI002AAAFA2A|nr:class I SAM-dependent methyltransferase [uncultured Paludibaculum sp.]
MKPRPPVTASVRFREKASELKELPLDKVFTTIHDTNLWGADESVSGLGSEDSATLRLREELPKLLADLGAKTLLDIPCGDFGWLSKADLPIRRYIGADLVETLVQANRAKFAGQPGKEFLRLDLCSDELPRADVVFCRDCLVHLSLENVRRAVANLKRSGSTWLLTTTFLECERNDDILNGDWRMLNFELEPFRWPAPVRVLVEGCTESGGGYEDKALGLWKLADL